MCISKLGCSNGSCVCVPMEVYGSFRISIDKKAVMCQFGLSLSHFLLNPYTHVMFAIRDRQPTGFIFDANELIQFIIWFNKISANHSCVHQLSFCFPSERNGTKWILSSDLRMTLVSLCFRVPCANPRVASGVCVRSNVAESIHTHTYTHAMAKTNSVYIILCLGSIWMCSWNHDLQSNGEFCWKPKKSIFFGVMAIKW